MDKKSKKDKIAKCKDTKKKWIKPQIKEHRLQDEESSVFDEVLLSPNDPTS